MPDVAILYEEGPCLAVAKPPGLLTQSPPGIDSLEDRVLAMLRERDPPPAPLYVGVPHRLDRPVSGALVLGLTKKATRRLGKQFERKEVRKVYWALVSGEVRPPAGEWRDPMRKIPGLARAEIVDESHPEGKLAVLRYRTLGATPWGVWLSLEPETGRMHQIRLQAASRGHPILGDALYGSRVAFGPQHEDPRLRAIALHARELELAHPKTKRHVAVVAPPPAFWSDTS